MTNDVIVNALPMTVANFIIVGTSGASAAEFASSFAAQHLYTNMRSTFNGGVLMTLLSLCRAVMVVYRRQRQYGTNCRICGYMPRLV